MFSKFIVPTIASIMLLVSACEATEEAIDDFDDQYSTVSIDGGDTRTFDTILAYPVMLWKIQPI